MKYENTIREIREEIDQSTQELSFGLRRAISFQARAYQEGLNDDRLSSFSTGGYERESSGQGPRRADFGYLAFE